MDNIYLDNAATTKVTPKVLKKINEVLKNNYANPSSLHKLGIESEKVIKNARRNIADALDIRPGELIFTGSGTTANNIAIQGTVHRLEKFGKKIITSKVEHKSVLEIFKHFEQAGFEVVYIPVDQNGIINLSKLKEAVDDETILVSIMAVNNELGSCQPLREISNIIDNYDNIYFHVDGVQAFGKVPVKIKNLNIDLFTISSHKIHGPKGIGALYINKDIIIDKILFGSSQEKGFYPGTENTAGIAGFGKAAEHLPNQKEISHIKNLRDKLKDKIKGEIPDVIINTPSGEKAAPHILNVSFKGIKGEVLVHSLERDGIFVSTGSACSSRRDSVSHVIKALNTPKNYREGSIRFSFSPYNTEQEVEYAFKSIKKNVESLRKIMG